MTKEKLNLPKTTPMENPNPSGEEVTIEVELEDSPLTSVVRTILEKTKEKSDYRSF
tara:strand:- start:843 stop:1010 length:168 start_codon:yes stop_codon:yes gene_type:complete